MHAMKGTTFIRNYFYTLGKVAINRWQWTLVMRLFKSDRDDVWPSENEKIIGVDGGMGKQLEKSF